mgnify:CR=1 FL=1
MMVVMGMVHIHAGKGVYIADRHHQTPLDQDRNRQAGQVYQFRLAIEPYVAGLAAQMRSKDHLDALETSITDMRTALEQDDLIAANQQVGVAGEATTALNAATAAVTAGICYPRPFLCSF